MASSRKSAPEAHANSNNDGKYPDVNWEEMGFSLTPTDYMYVMKCSIGEKFSQGSLIPYGNIELSPCSGILNYGQGLFEGMKAYRKEDGRILLFRPEQNALRMKEGAERLCMPSPSIEQFVGAVKQTVLANERWSQRSLHLVVEEKHHRASSGGTGGIKTVANYSPVLNALTRAKAQGFSEVLFLDAATGKFIDEASACNIFSVKGNIISTPPTHGTILPGITRKSIIEIAPTLGYQVDERPVAIDELLDADEAFCTGTAIVVTSIGSVTHQGRRIDYKTQADTVCQKLHEMLTGIQMGRLADTMGWMVEVN